MRAVGVRPIPLYDPLPDVGAVVTKDVPPYALVAGVPAKRVGWACECGEILRFEGDRATCSCGRAYERVGEEAIRRVV